MLELLMLHDINEDLQIANSEKINPTESTNGHPEAETYVKISRIPSTCRWKV